MFPKRFMINFLGQNSFEQDTLEQKKNYKKKLFWINLTHRGNKPQILMRMIQHSFHLWNRRQKKLLKIFCILVCFFNLSLKLNYFTFGWTLRPETVIWYFLNQL
jgi:hypothetical protein